MVYFYIVGQLENNVAYTSTQKDASNTVVSSPLQMLHNKAVRLQNQTKIDNAAQSSAFWALRSGGKAEAAAQMANPISTQTIHSAKYGTYVVEGRDTSNDNRAAAEQRTLDLALEKQARLKAEQEKKARAEAQMISTSNNSRQIANDFSDTSKYLVHNNNVNPASLYTPQPVNVTGTSQNSSVSGGVNVDANYNFATQMNDWLNANPTSQVNMGESAQAWGYTAGLSSIPKDNDVESSILGGNGQHQETDVSTNATAYNSFMPQPKSVNYSQNLPALSSTAIILGGAAALLFLGRRK